MGTGWVLILFGRESIVQVGLETPGRSIGNMKTCSYYSWQGELERGQVPLPRLL